MKQCASEGTVWYVEVDGKKYLKGYYQLGVIYELVSFDLFGEPVYAPAEAQ